MSKKAIAIIGGGACGVAAFIELFLRLKIAGKHDEVIINIIEKKAKVGQGLAFGTRQPGHILNTQANLMGIHAREPEHFGQWVRENAHKYGYEAIAQLTDEQMYPPRQLYGQYMEAQFAHYLQQALAGGMQVHVIQDEATDAAAEGQQWKITLASGNTIAADYMILAVGTPKRNNYSHFRSNAKYIDFPWPSSCIKEKVPKGATVAILGSSLSAIDTLMTFDDNGHEGSLALYSHNALLPRVQPEVNSTYDRKYLTLNNIHRQMRDRLRSVTATGLFRLFQQEAEHYEGKSIDWKTTGRKGQPASKLLKEDIHVAQLGGDAFQNIAYSLRYDTSVIWSLLSLEEKLRFAHWIGSYWNINRHGMPLVNALRIRNLFDKGQLFVRPGLKSVTYDEQTEKFQLTHEHGQCDAADYLINATGTAMRIKDMDVTMIRNMHHKKYIVPHEAGGICINRQNMRVLSPNLTYDNLYAVGQIANGELLDTNAVWFNVKTIAKMCQDILYQLDRGDIS